jgi:hypothetical protein
LPERISLPTTTSAQLRSRIRAPCAIRLRLHYRKRRLSAAMG